MAITPIVSPTKPSNTCQARGRANHGASQRAPKPSKPNHTAHMFAAQALTQHESVLRADGHDETQAQRQALHKDGCQKRNGVR